MNPLTKIAGLLCLLVVFSTLSCDRPASMAPNAKQESQPEETEKQEKIVENADELQAVLNDYTPRTVIRLKRGVYRLDKPIEILKDIAFIGQGAQEDVMVEHEGYSTFIVRGGKVRFENMSIRGRYDKQPFLESADRGTILVLGGSVDLMDTIVNAKNMPCIEVSGERSVTRIDHTICDGGSSGIAVSDRGRASILNSTLQNCIRFGLVIADGSEVHVEQTTIKNCEYGIAARDEGGGLPRIVADKCSIHDISQAGVGSTGGNVTCLDTKISRCHVFAIAFGGDKKGIGRFENCDVVDNNDNLCVRLENCSFDMKNCKIRSTDMHQDRCVGMRIMDKCETFLDNCIFDHRGIGVIFQAVERDNLKRVFRNCKFYCDETSAALLTNIGQPEDLTPGIPDLDSWGIFEKCEFAKFNNFAIQSESRDPRLLFKDCDFYDGNGGKTPDGIVPGAISFVGQYLDGPRGTIENCRFFRLEGAAVVIGRAGDVIVRNCKMEDLDYGVLVCESAMCQVEKCEITDANIHGFMIKSDKPCKFIGNKITNCKERDWELTPDAINLIRIDNEPNE